MVGASLLDALFGVAACRNAFDCTLAIDRTGGVVLWFLLFTYSLKTLAKVGDEYFGRSLDRIAKKMEMTPDMAGCTILALGASGFEFFASIISTALLAEVAGLAVVLGSTAFNVLVINGIVACTACTSSDDGSKEKTELRTWWYPLTRDFFFNLLALVELFFILLDGWVTTGESLVMLFTYFLYCIYMKCNWRVMKRYGIINPFDPEEEDLAPTKWGRCSNFHPFAPVVASTSGPCSLCNGVVKTREVVLECDRCDPTYWLCGRCFETVRRAELADEQRLREEALARATEEAERTAAAEAVALAAAPEATELDEVGPPLQDQPAAASASSTDLEGAWREEPLPPMVKFKSIMQEFIRSQSVTDLAELEDKEDVALQAKNKEPQVWPGFLAWFLGRTDPLAAILKSCMPSPKRHPRVAFLLSAGWMLGVVYVAVDAGLRAGEVLVLHPRIAGLLVISIGSLFVDAVRAPGLMLSGRGGMDVANSLGSSVFDLLFALGLPWSARCIFTGRRLDLRADQKMLDIDVCVIVGMLLLFIVPLAVNGWKLTRFLGMVWILTYLVWVACLLATA